MNFTGNIIINMYSAVILIFIYIHVMIHTDKNSFAHKLYLIMLQAAGLMLVVDVLSRFDGNPGTFYAALNQTGNFMVFILSPVLPSLWFLYAHYQVFHEEKKTRQCVRPLAAIAAVHAVLVICSLFYQWFYYIDAENIYHRGSLFWVSASVTGGLAIAASILIIANKKRIEKKYYFSLVFFPIPPILCVVLQIYFYGASLMLNGVTLSLLIIFFNIQNSNIYTDYLTGVYNRKKLEQHLNEKISIASENQTFSAILIDINNFKAINDNFGHDMGDDALITTVKLLKGCLSPADFIARFGGDELYVIQDVSNSAELEETVLKINQCVERYNEQSTKPYRLGFSMGYAVYDSHRRLGAKEFQKLLDRLMYQDKRLNKVMCADSN